MPRPAASQMTKTYKVKVCFVGDEGVGKTSLIRRFVTGMFDESYIRTLGAVVSKKSVEFADVEPRPVRVDMMVLDIMGKRTFMQLFREAYFNGAKAILAVFDVTRPDSLEGLTPWIDSVRETVGPIPITLLGNKVDLTERRRVDEAQAEAALGRYDSSILYTSAKTGENVDEAFTGLARDILKEGAEEPGDAN